MVTIKLIWVLSTTEIATNEIGAQTIEESDEISIGRRRGGRSGGGRRGQTQPHPFPDPRRRRRRRGFDDRGLLDDRRRRFCVDGRWGPRVAFGRGKRRR